MPSYGDATGPEYLDERDAAAAASTQTCDCGGDLDAYGDHRPAADACEECGHRLGYCDCGVARDAALDAQERMDD